MSILFEILDYCKEQSNPEYIIDFCCLVDFCRKNRLDWLKALMDVNVCYLVYSYIESLYDYFDYIEDVEV